MPASGSTDRFERSELLGTGSMGAVYRARDLKTGRAVALKTLHTLDPDSIYRLKHEFRALANVTHENLVELYDLVVSGDQCFITMELIEGAPFVEFVRTAGTPDAIAGRLVSALRQLVAGVGALHANGKLHRDLKPSNVLIEPDGHVVVLDFGLVSDLFSDRSQRSRAGALAGTLAYMAPEQARGELLEPAADLYSVGVMAYESLTGVLPFDASTLAALLDRSSLEVPSPAGDGADAPPELDALTRDLLSPDPNARPTARVALDRLARIRGEPSAPSVHASPARSAPFVGRQRELRAVRQAFAACRDSGIHTVCVEGVSGIGKTALIERFLAELDAGEALVLRARCHPFEDVPYKGVDALIDELARHLSHETDARVESVLPRNVAALLRVFPVLERVPAVAKARGRGELGVDPAETRRRAFQSLRELVERLSDRVPLVLWIDDLQWSDRDSAALLGNLREQAETPRVLLLLSLRSDRNAPVEALAGVVGTDPADESVHRFELGPLAAGEARELVSALTASVQTIEPERLEALVLESGGSPFFASELARYLVEQRADPPGRGADGRPRPESALMEVLAARVRDLPDAARRLLQTVAVAGHALEESVAFAATPATGSAGSAEMSDAARLLVRQRLLRLDAGSGENQLAPYHDRIRDAVVGATPEHDLPEVHLRLAQALQQHDGSDPHLLIHHFTNAGDELRAGVLAYELAEQATRGLAFNRAASLYQHCIALGAAVHPAWQLQARLGDALVNAGRGAEGGHHLERAADLLAVEQPGDVEVLRLRRRAATELLRSGVYADGLRVLRDVLDAAGLWYPATANRALAALIWSRMGLPWPGQTPRRFTTPREQLETCWSAGHGLSLFDPIRAAEFQVRHHRLARRLGDREHLALAVASGSLILAMEGGERKQRRCAIMARDAERLGRDVGSPNLEAYRLMTLAVAAFSQWRFRDALEICDRGVALCRDHCIGAGWERANLQSCAAMALVNLGEYRELWRRLPGELREADEHSDLYSVLMLRIGYANAAWLARDRSDIARREIERALEGPFPDTFTWQFHQGLYAAVQVLLYEGAWEDAHRRLLEGWPALRRTGILRFGIVRAAQVELRARAHVAALVERFPFGAKWRAVAGARRDLRRLGRERTPATEPCVASLRAALHALAGERDAASVDLERAAVGFDRLDMRAHSASVRLQHQLLTTGRLADDESGPVSWMRAHGIEAPLRFAALLVPGPWERAAGLDWTGRDRAKLALS